MNTFGHLFENLLLFFYILYIFVTYLIIFMTVLLHHFLFHLKFKLNNNNINMF